MNSNTKKYLITSEKVERTVVRPLQTQASIQLCRSCLVAVEMLSLEFAASSSGIPMRRLFEMTENGRLHYVETDEGRLLICKSSLEAISRYSEAG